ncbi:MAG: YciI family protein [Acidobacteriaceae bacterium]|nr:YciI family protein [Acidobacteriaceae bacterium]
MRYMMLIYSNESETGPSCEEAEQIKAAHWAVMQEAAQKGVLRAAEPLAPTATATTVRIQDGKALTTDGPFAETKEQLAGYYILECANLDEAIDWAAKIPTACKGREGCIEIRPMPGLPSRSKREPAFAEAVRVND